MLNKKDERKYQMNLMYKILRQQKKQHLHLRLPIFDNLNSDVIDNTIFLKIFHQSKIIKIKIKKN